LYRDNHAWCPYSQKVWLWLEEKRIPYRVEKVTLHCYGQKEPWYRKLVPSGEVPAIEMDGDMIADSDAIIEHLEKEYGVLHCSITDTNVRNLAVIERKLYEEWLNWLTKPDRSPTEAAIRKKRFIKVVDFIERILGEKAGPYFLEEFSVADVVFTPFIERANATAFYFKGFRVRYGQFPNIDRWFTAMETRDAYRGSLSDYHTTCHVTPPLFGTCFESGDPEQKRCKSAIDDGPFLTIPDVHFDPPPDAIEICLARSVKHHSSILKQQPQRHANSDEAFRCALTYLITGVRIPPPPGTNSSLRYIRDRVSCPRDMPPHSAELFRHCCEQIAALDGHERGTPIPQQHRLDQEPFAFIKAKQQTELEVANEPEQDRAQAPQPQAPPPSQRQPPPAGEGSDDEQEP